MRKIRNFHHYRPESIASDDNISRLEQYVASLLIDNSLGDSKRESSAIFELKHSSNVTQFARLLAGSYGICEEVAAAGVLLHDIYVIVEGKYKNHAKLGVPIADGLLVDHGIKCDSKRIEIAQIVGNHSDKHIYSSDPLIEFGKDVDVLDCFLYPNAIEYYLLNKSVQSTFHYMNRAKNMWNKLNIVCPREFESLDHFKSGWIGTKTLDYALGKKLVSALIKSANLPFFACRKAGSKLEIFFPTMRYNAVSSIIQDMSSVQKMSSSSRSVSEIVAAIERLEVVVIWATIGVYEFLDSSQSAKARFEELCNFE